MTTHNLPHQSMPLIGRVEERAEIAALLADPACRLLTLLGPGGIGKTHLGIQAAADQLTHYKHGVYFVPLTGVGSPDLIASAIAGALNISFHGSEDPRLQIVRYLHEKHMLLVVDNFEHLLEGTALLTNILQAAARVKILATSRERLNLQEEWVLALQGLSFPEGETNQPLEDYSAVQLFVQRARQVNSTFSLSQNGEAVQAICQQVEGMPLGLELAASWLRAMSCHQIAAQMAGSLDFLTTPIRNVPERHRSVRAVFEQSWNLLSPAERDVLMRLSVFRGGFDWEAAEQVAGASLPLLVGLADKSLIRLNASGRYDLHEMLRQYAADKLLDAGEVNTAVQHHFDYFLKLAEAAETHTFGRDQIPWFDRIEVELDNVRAALAWSMEAESGLRFAAALGWFFSERYHLYEGLDWLERTLAANQDAPASLRAKALRSAGNLDGPTQRGRTLCEQALALARAANDPWNSAWSLNQLANMNILIKEFDQSAALLDESLALFRELEDAMGVAYSLVRRVWCALEQEDYPYARWLLEEVAIRAYEAGDKIMTAWVFYNKGCISWYRDHDLRQARTFLESSLSRFQEARLQTGCHTALLMMARVEQAAGNVERAQIHSEEALISLREANRPGQRLIQGRFLAALANVARVQGQLDRAARLLGAANSIALAAKRDTSEISNFDSEVAIIRAQLGETAFSEAWAVGNAMTQEQAVAFALEGRTTPAERANDSEVAQSQKAASQPLSEREREILSLAADGLSNREIADQLLLATSTVKWYLSEIYSKLNVNSRTQAIARTRELGLID